MQLDTDGNGTLTMDEIKAGLKKSSVKNVSEVMSTFESVDTDNSGKIDYTEFLSVTMEKNIYLREEKLYAAFKLFDKNDDGVISAQELK